VFGTKLSVNDEKTEKLVDAVFWKDRKRRNVFHQMMDNIAEIKAAQSEHESST
jgi:hypothetical protein